MAAEERKRELGARIAAARHEKRWKQKHLAAAVHVEPLTVSRWERGVYAPDMEMLDRVAEALERPIAFFLPEPTRPGVPSAEEQLAEVAASLARTAEGLADGLERFQALLDGLEDGRPRRPAP